MVGGRPSSLPKLGEKAQQLGSTGVNNSFSPDVDRILQLLFSFEKRRRKNGRCEDVLVG